MSLPDAASLIASLERAEARAVLVATGGGSAAITHLVGTPGASGVVLEGRVPSARAAVDDLLGGPQESYCSSRTARRLAVAAWQRGIALGAPAGTALGAAVTAALRTRRPKRGPHRAIAAVHTLAATRLATLVFDAGARSRADEEEIAAALLLDLVGGAAGAAGTALPAGMLRPGEALQRDAVEAPAAWRDLLGGTCDVVAATPACPAAPRPGAVIMPGSFDPLHEGHLAMARIAAEVAERPVEWELSVANVDKPTLDYLEIRDRVAQFAGLPLWLTRAATFLEKLDAFPGSTFVMGADTYVRLADPRYYGGSAGAAAEAVRVIAARARGLIVFGRIKDGAFVDPERLEVPPALRAIARFVPEREFRLDVSSTQLRRAAAAGPGGARRSGAD